MKLWWLAMVRKNQSFTNAVVQTTGESSNKRHLASLSNSLRKAGYMANQRGSWFDDAQILVRGANTYRNESY